jgi:hypothetical protein
MILGRVLSATLAVLSLPLCPAGAAAVDAEWDAAERTTRQRIAAASAALPADAPGQKLAALAEQAGADPRAFAALERAQDEYVARILSEWGNGPERKAFQEAGLQLQRNAERTSAALRAAAEAGDAAAIRMLHSGVLGKIARLEAAAKEAGVRLAGRWERERAMREREREQREREAAERARDQRR